MEGGGVNREERNKRRGREKEKWIRERGREQGRRGAKGVAS